MYGYLNFVLWLMFMSGFLVFCSMRKHLLLTLLSLEFLVLCLYILFFVFLFLYELSMYFLLIFLTFSVCEGVMGLGILVSIIRSHGGDGVNSLSVLGW
uniref:NADH-ubiquinone oxidoreductase chain 4L n=1 Tax=Valentia hoffmanni TaxID=575843 RepID=C5HIY7_9HEMI|nr:NADH dehydrogenase subunit 4L [Valentia hoffmanni]ACJ69582.1 NADH dehydrogenase subunit 4L [Valentia hoffmanni]